jgi:hypothetical protein
MLERVRDAGMEITMETKAVTIDANIGPVPGMIAFFNGDRMQKWWSYLKTRFCSSLRRP